MKQIVTKEFLIKKLGENPQLVVGRALVALFNNQTTAEQSCNVTRVQNGRGFTQSDARIGSLGAKYYLRHGRLEDWMIKNWQLPNKKGEPRIVKYHKQLNQIANERLRINAAAQG